MRMLDGSAAKLEEITAHLMYTSSGHVSEPRPQASGFERARNLELLSCAGSQVKMSRLCERVWNTSVENPPLADMTSENLAISYGF